MSYPPPHYAATGVSSHHYPASNNDAPVHVEKKPRLASSTYASGSSAAAAAASSSSHSGSVAAAAAAAALEDDESGPSAEVVKPTTTAGTRRGGRVAAVTEIRAEQKEAMSRVATMAEHGVDCPSWYGFKNKEFVRKRTAAIGPGRQWRNYRQIVERENYHLIPPSTPTYSSIRSGPSSLPPKKYCDLTGFPAKYTDPKTHLNYYSAAEYQKIKAMPTDTIKQMLEIRGQTPSHQLMLR